MATIDNVKYANGTAGGQIKTGAGAFYGVIVNSHSSGTLRFNDGTTGTTGAGVKATGTITTTGTFSDDEVIVIGDETYTMKATLTGEPNEVLIGANAAASLDNLKSAINGTAGEGSTYGTGTIANVQVTATTNMDASQVVEAIRIGTYGNALVTTTDAANASWGAGTLESGAESSVLICNTITFAAGSGIVVNIPQGISFQNGLYATKGGTIDYTILYT